VLPHVKGWYEIAPARVIDTKQSTPVRIWTDGTGGFWSPTVLTKEVALQMRVKPSEVLSKSASGDQLLVMLPISGSFHNTNFRALGPLLDARLPQSPTPEVLRPYQRPENYLTPAQRREWSPTDTEGAGGE